MTLPPLIHLSLNEVSTDMKRGSDSRDGPSGDDPDEPGSKQSRTNDGHDSEATDIDEEADPASFDRDEDYDDQALIGYRLLQARIAGIYSTTSRVATANDMASELLRLTHRIKELLFEMRDDADESSDKAIQALVQSFTGYTLSASEWSPPADRDHTSYFMDVKELLDSGTVNVQDRTLLPKPDPYNAPQYQEVEYNNEQSDAETKYRDDFVDPLFARYNWSASRNKFTGLLLSLLKSTDTGEENGSGEKNALELLESDGRLTEDPSYTPSAVADGFQKTVSAVFKRYTLMIVSATSISQHVKQTTAGAASSSATSANDGVYMSVAATANALLDCLDRMTVVYVKGPTGEYGDIITFRQTEEELSEDIALLLSFVRQSRELERGSSSDSPPQAYEGSLNLQRASRLLHLMISHMSLLVLIHTAFKPDENTVVGRIFVDKVAPFISDHVYKGNYLPKDESSTSEDTQIDYSQMDYIAKTWFEL